MSIPDIFKNYIKNETRSNYKTINIRKPKSLLLSQEEALEDVDALFYIINYGYSGRDFWEKNKGFDYQKAYDISLNIIKSVKEIDIRSLCEFFHKLFSEIIVDNHLMFYTKFNGYMDFRANKYAYFSDIIVEKIENTFIVFKSNTNDVCVGDILECDNNCMFATLSPKNKDLYLIGMRDWHDLSEMTIKING